MVCFSKMRIWLFSFYLTKVILSNMTSTPLFAMHFPTAFVEEELCIGHYWAVIGVADSVVAATGTG